MSLLEKLFSIIKKQGFTVGYSSGKPINPETQERTDAVADILKADKKKGGKNGNRL